MPCHEVSGSALTVYVLMATRANSILVEGSANLLSFHTTHKLSCKSALYIPGHMEPTLHYGVTSE